MDALDYLPSPCGLIAISANAVGINAVTFIDTMERPVRPSQLTQQAKQQLSEYLSGSRTQFDLPLSLQGTDFQKRVWTALLAVDFGTTASYLQIANAIANPQACRAVGAANGKNPVSIIVPCHRVIGSNGTLTGYAGGITRKQWLLEHERRN